jgi:cytochrome c556
MSDRIRHEATILATLAEVLMKPGLESADDKEYVGHAKALQKSALEVLAGVKANNFEQTRTAVGNISKSCTACHATYR